MAWKRVEPDKNSPEWHLAQMEINRWERDRANLITLLKFGALFLVAYAAVLIYYRRCS